MYVISNTSASYYQTAHNQNGYGGMAYYSSVTCGYNGSEGCTTDYAQSEFKYVVDAWKASEAPLATEARLITFEELTNNLGFELQQVNPSTQGYKYTENTPSWAYNSNYNYWTMSPYNDSALHVWHVDFGGKVGSNYVYNYDSVVRPVITLLKSSLEKQLN